MLKFIFEKAVRPALAVHALLLGLCPPAFALTGIYINEQEHIPQACMLMGKQMEKISIPFYPGPKGLDGPGGKRGKPIIEKLANDLICSATLVGTNELITAAHCYPKIMEKEYVMEHFQRRRKIPECDKPDWRMDKGCVEKEAYFIVNRRVKELTAICPGNLPGGSGQVEERDIEWKMSWPNPNFRMIRGSDETAFYDQMIVRSKEKFNIPPLPMALDFYQNKAYLHHFKSCRVFGYGRDNDMEAGRLHGIRIPNVQTSTFLTQFKSKINSIEGGDSGGSFVCKDSDRPDAKGHLVGVVSTYQAVEPGTFTLGERHSGFSNISSGTGRRWIDYIQKQVPLSARHSGEKPDRTRDPELDTYVAEFDLYVELPGEMNDLRACVADFKSLYPRADFSGYETTLEGLEKGYLGIQTEYEMSKAGAQVVPNQIAVPISKVGAYFGEDFKIPLITEKANFPRSRSYTSNARMAVDQSYRIVRPEIAYCQNRGMSFDGKGHDFLDRGPERFRAEIIEPRLKKWWPN